MAAKPVVRIIEFEYGAVTACISPIPKEWTARGIRHPSEVEGVDG
jgi:hypothetical protein